MKNQTSTSTSKYLKFGGLIVVILSTLGWLAVTGASDSQSYFKTVAEVHAMGGEAMNKRLRVGGDVVEGSIRRDGTSVHFTILWEGQKMNVMYSGTEPLPDTFRDGAQALADGKLQSDGTFHATRVQAKCASKYEAKPGGKAARVPVYGAPQTKS